MEIYSLLLQISRKVQHLFTNSLLLWRSHLINYNVIIATDKQEHYIYDSSCTPNYFKRGYKFNQIEQKFKIKFKINMAHII